MTRYCMQNLILLSPEFEAFSESLESIWINISNSTSSNQFWPTVRISSLRSQSVHAEIEPSPFRVLGVKTLRGYPFVHAILMLDMHME